MSNAIKFLKENHTKVEYGTFTGDYIKVIEVDTSPQMLNFTADEFSASPSDWMLLDAYLSDSDEMNALVDAINSRDDVCTEYCLKRLKAKAEKNLIMHIKDVLKGALK
jgi:hypothetical protein